MRIEIVERMPVRIAYRRYTGPLGEPLSWFWRANVMPWLADHGLLDAPRYGVTLDDPARTPADAIRYDVCVELPPGIKLPDADEGTIAGGGYAVLPFKGLSVEIGARWQGFVAECLATLRVDATRPPFERYPRGAWFDPKSGAFSCELCFPVSS